MTDNGLNAFEIALILTDLTAKNCSQDPAIRINGRISIAHAADCYIALAPRDQAAARKLVGKHLPVGGL